MKQGISRAVMLALMACWLFLSVLLVTSEAGSVSVNPATSPVELRSERPLLPPRNPSDVFELYMSTDIPPASGFDFPVGDRDGQGPYTDLSTGKSHHGWYVSVRFAEWYKYGLHPGEDWNGTGGANTDLGQPVHAVAAGRVVFAANCGQPSGGVVVIQHVYHENHLKRRVRSVYRHIEGIRVKAGQVVRRRQILGGLGHDPKGTFHAHLHIEIRTNEDLSPTYWPSAHRGTRSAEWLRANYLEPSAFIRAHRHLFVPQQEEHLMLVDSGSNRMRVYREGRLLAQYTVGLPPRTRSVDSGDRAGPPRGMYFVVHRHELRLAGPAGSRIERHWLDLNYPNQFDACRARKLGLIRDDEEADISQAWRERRTTQLPSPLGRRLGILGAVESWDASIPGGASAGNILMRRQDLRQALDWIPNKTMVIIF